MQNNNYEVDISKNNAKMKRKNQFQNQKIIQVWKKLVKKVEIKVIYLQKKGTLILMKLKKVNIDWLQIVKNQLKMKRMKIRTNIWVQISRIMI